MCCFFHGDGPKEFAIAIKMQVLSENERRIFKTQGTP